MAVFNFESILRALLLIIAISAVLSAPQQKQTVTATTTTQKQYVADMKGVAQVQDPKCLQPMERGPCRMNLDRFYYNSQTKTCEPFKFGGCRGNDNKFGFLKTCEDACIVSTKTTTNNVVNSKTPTAGTNTPTDGTKTSATGTKTLATGSNTPTTGTKTPAADTLPKPVANAPISTTTTTKAPIVVAQTQPKVTKPIK